MEPEPFLAVMVMETTYKNNQKEKTKLQRYKSEIKQKNY